MKKRFLATFLALVMCLALLPTAALAAEVEVASNILFRSDREDMRYSLTINDTSGKAQDLGAANLFVRNWDVAFVQSDPSGPNSTYLSTWTRKEKESLSLDHVFTLPTGSEIIVRSTEDWMEDGGFYCRAWSDPDGDGIYDRQLCKIQWDLFEDEGRLTVDTSLLPLDQAGPLTGRGELTDTEEHYLWYSDAWEVHCGGGIYFHTEGYGGGLEGPDCNIPISADYLMETFGPNTLFSLDFCQEYDTNPNLVSYGSSYYFLLTGDQSITPTQPDKPVTPAPATALPTNDKLKVDGVEKAPAAYKINNANFFKLRDVAMLVNGTKGQFSIDYDGEKNAIMITTGQPYSPVGGELTTMPAGNATADPSNDAVYINGVKTDLTAYKIGGANFYGIRELGRALGFNVGWKSGVGMFIETDKPYTDAD